jgi:hypothetical protein
MGLVEIIVKVNEAFFLSLPFLEFFIGFFFFSQRSILHYYSQPPQLNNQIPVLR